MLEDRIFLASFLWWLLFFSGLSYWLFPPLGSVAIVGLASPLIFVSIFFLWRS